MDTRLLREALVKALSEPTRTDLDLLGENLRILVEDLNNRKHIERFAKALISSDRDKEEGRKLQGVIRKLSKGDLKGASAIIKRMNDEIVRQLAHFLDNEIATKLKIRLRTRVS